MITLHTPLAPTLTALKLLLTQRLPEVKSSHRAEALARGLGYRAYASLLAASRERAPTPVTADAAPFGAYLAAHGFEVDPNVLHRALATVAVQNVMAPHPRLASHGFGVGQPRPTMPNRLETFGETLARFRNKRRDMLSEDFAEAVLLASAFVSRVPKTRTIRPHTNSYWLKHIAEKLACTYPDGRRLGPGYVPNGALIAAAIHAGFDCRHGDDELGYEHPNASFNMPKRALEDLDCEIRRDGARAQDRRRREEARRFPFAVI